MRAAAAALCVLISVPLSAKTVVEWSGTVGPGFVYHELGAPALNNYDSPTLVDGQLFRLDVVVENAPADIEVNALVSYRSNDFYRNGAVQPAGATTSPALLANDGSGRWSYQLRSVFRFFPRPAGSDFIGTLTGSALTGVYIEPGAFQGTYRATISSVPEPATWAMMIAGFALLGAAVRQMRPRLVEV